MSAIRVTAMLCITVLVIITGALVHSNTQDRYIILPQNNSMFIFDRKTSSVNYCTADQCKLVMPFGSASMPGMPGGMNLMTGMGGGTPTMMTSMPQGFQPYVNPGANNADMMVSTSMNNSMGNPMNNPMVARNNNPMMMLAYMQAASIASTSAQQGGFSSLQSQPSWMNMMAMMQPTDANPENVVAAQSPIVPVAMTTDTPPTTKKTKKVKPKISTSKPTSNNATSTAKVPTNSTTSGDSGDESSSDDDSDDGTAASNDTTSGDTTSGDSSDDNDTTSDDDNS